MANNSKRGLASADDETKERVARAGGKASGGNPQNLTQEGRAKGGRNSRGGGNNS
jgi:general stress protein YciG